MNNHKDLEVWKKSIDFVDSILLAYQKLKRYEVITFDKKLSKLLNWWVETSEIFKLSSWTWEWTCHPEFISGSKKQDAETSSAWQKIKDCHSGLSLPAVAGSGIYKN